MLTRLLLATGVVLATLVMPGLSAQAASGAKAPAAKPAVSTLDANKAVVRAFYDTAFNQQKPAEAVAKYLGPQYKQHNPMAKDGGAAFIAFVTGFIKANPELRVDFKRFIAEGDLVVVHSHITLNPADRGTAAVDIFRVQHGKVVEHWDVLQAVPETSANPNTMF